ncbi:hypothetical protein AB6A40_007885 [Gnathostoma spinigerum]|uniref:Ras modification protein ERF4 n=1 Tax=Gnathostoma spinigerum TaxID=75299 RepID=A0ABD6EUP6_9BILA
MGSPNEVKIPLNSCSKIFVQRDYSKGLGVRFETKLPQAMQGKIKEEQWLYTISELNSHYDKAEQVCCATVLETCVGCLSCYISRIFTKTQYEKELIEISRFLAEQNKMVYIPAGFYLTDPMERGLRVLEVSIITSSSVLSHDEGKTSTYSAGFDRTR